MTAFIVSVNCVNKTLWVKKQKQARNTTFTILTIKLFYAKIKREPNKLEKLEK